VLGGCTHAPAPAPVGNHVGPAHVESFRFREIATGTDSLMLDASERTTYDLELAGARATLVITHEKGPLALLDDTRMKWTFVSKETYRGTSATEDDMLELDLHAQGGAGGLYFACHNETLMVLDAGARIVPSRSHGCAGARGRAAVGPGTWSLAKQTPVPARVCVHDSADVDNVFFVLARPRIDRVDDATDCEGGSGYRFAP
jgi:hypothetical protein